MWRKLWPLGHLCGLYLDSLLLAQLWTPLSRCSLARAGQRSTLLSTWAPRSLSAELPSSMICDLSPWPHMCAGDKVLVSCRDHPCPEDVPMSPWDSFIVLEIFGTIYFPSKNGKEQLEICSTQLKLADPLLKQCSHALLYKLPFRGSQRTPGCPHAQFTFTNVRSWSRSWENALKLPTAIETTYSLNLGTLKGLHLSKKTSLVGTALCPHCVYFLCFRGSTRLKTSIADKGQKKSRISHIWASASIPS